MPQSFWNDIGNQKAFLLWLHKELSNQQKEGKRKGRKAKENEKRGGGEEGVNSEFYESWYTVTTQDFLKNNGQGLLAHYAYSLSTLLSKVFPEYKWLPWKFNLTPKGYWSDAGNQKSYLEWLGKRLGYNSEEDWYKVKLKDFTENFGGTLVKRHYQGSPYFLLRKAFPEFTYHPWKFAHSSSVGSRSDLGAELVTYIEETLGIKSDSDWNRINHKQLRSVGVSSTVTKLGGLVPLLRKHRSRVQLEELSRTSES